MRELTPCTAWGVAKKPLSDTIKEICHWGQGHCLTGPPEWRTCPPTTGHHLPFSFPILDPNTPDFQVSTGWHTELKPGWRLQGWAQEEPQGHGQGRGGGGPSRPQHVSLANMFITGCEVQLLQVFPSFSVSGFYWLEYLSCITCYSTL